MVRRWFFVGLLLALLSACGTRGPDPGLGGAPLLTDADLDAAATWEHTPDSVLVAILPAPGLRVAPGEARSALAALERPSLSDFPERSGLETLALELDTTGYLIYVQEVAVRGGSRYFIRARETRQGRARYPSDLLLYRGSRAIDSAAISADGSLVTFSARSSGTDSYDIYALDRTGATFGQRGLLKLTATPDADERNVSMSLDGRTHAWQSTNAAGVGVLTVAHIDAGALLFSSLTLDFSGIDVSQPSLSGDGSLLAFVADLGADDAVALIPADGSANAVALYAGAVRQPSLSAAGEQLMFAATLGATDLVALDDGSQLNILVSAPAGDIEHPYLTSDGFYFTYGLRDTLRTRAVDTEDPESAAEDVVDRSDTSRAMYWAKTGFDLRYFGSTLGAPTFTRPDDGTGLTDAERTVPYHAYRFRILASDAYEMLSRQDYDGYLLLYEGRFDPRQPERNLLAQNDDFGGGYSPDGEPPGQSRLYAELEAGKTYVLVTAACGDPNAGCGPIAGRFINQIVRGGTPPLPPDVLPDPDPSRYNITVRFATDNLTLEQRQVVLDAAARWEAIITGDLQAITSFSLPQAFFFPDTPPVEGTLDDVLIDLAFSDLDGPGGLLGRAGPVLIRQGTADDPLTVYGVMEFDIAEFEPGGFFDDRQRYEDVVVHEMGHVLGIGTLWQLTGNTEGILANPPTVPPGLPNPNYDPRFTGAGAIAEYQKLLQDAGRSLEESVPIDNTGGPGNYNGHWREIVFGDELMTPYAGGVELLSRMTAASLGDLGYTVSLASSAIDASYTLPPPYVPGIFRQLAPTPTNYAEGEDFFIATESPPVFNVSGNVANVDLNLGDVPGSTSACEAADFADFSAGSIALIRRGGCTFEQKVLNAQEAGATAVILMNTGTEGNTGVFAPSLGAAADTIPVVAITFDLGVTLAGTPGLTVNIRKDAPGMGLETLRRAGEMVPFEEELLFPIGTVGPDGEVEFFDDE